MFRNAFQEPKPGNRDELIETFDELDLNPAECSATVAEYPDEGEPYNGWCVAVTGEDSEGELIEFDSVAWASLDALRNDLRAVGLTRITVE